MLKLFHVDDEIMKGQLKRFKTLNAISTQNIESTAPTTPPTTPTTPSRFNLIPSPLPAGSGDGVLYVCMYASMHVRMYACMHLRKNLEKIFQKQLKLAKNSRAAENFIMK